MKRIVTFDVETSGLDYNKAKIMQIGLHDVETGRSFEAFIEHETLNMEHDARELHTRTGFMEDYNLADKIPESHVAFAMKAWLNQLGGADEIEFVAHNATFDLSFVKHSAFKELIPKAYDTLKYFRQAQYKNKPGKFSLDALAEKYGITGAGKHNAAADAAVTAQVMAKAGVNLEKLIKEDTLYDQDTAVLKQDVQKLVQDTANDFKMKQAFVRGFLKKELAVFFKRGGNLGQTPGVEFLKAIGVEPGSKRSIKMALSIIDKTLDLVAKEAISTFGDNPSADNVALLKSQFEAKINVILKDTMTDLNKQLKVFGDIVNGNFTPSNAKLKSAADILSNVFSDRLIRVKSTDSIHSDVVAEKVNSTVYTTGNKPTSVDFNKKMAGLSTDKLMDMLAEHRRATYKKRVIAKQARIAAERVLANRESLLEYDQNLASGKLTRVQIYNPPKPITLAVLTGEVSNHSGFKCNINQNDLKRTLTSTYAELKSLQTRMKKIEDTVTTAELTPEQQRVIAETIKVKAGIKVKHEIEYNRLTERLSKAERANYKRASSVKQYLDDVKLGNYIDNSYARSFEKKKQPQPVSKYKTELERSYAEAMRPFNLPKKRLKRGMAAKLYKSGLKPQKMTMKPVRYKMPPEYKEEHKQLMEQQELELRKKFTDSEFIKYIRANPETKRTLPNVHKPDILLMSSADRRKIFDTAGPAELTKLKAILSDYNNAVALTKIHITMMKEDWIKEATTQYADDQLRVNHPDIIMATMTPKEVRNALRYAAEVIAAESPEKLAEISLDSKEGGKLLKKQIEAKQDAILVATHNNVSTKELTKELDALKAQYSKLKLLNKTLVDSTNEQIVAQEAFKQAAKLRAHDIATNPVAAMKHLRATNPDEFIARDNERIAREQAQEEANYMNKVRDIRKKEASDVTKKMVADAWELTWNEAHHMNKVRDIRKKEAMKQAEARRQMVDTVIGAPAKALDATRRNIVGLSQGLNQLGSAMDSAAIKTGIFYAMVSKQYFDSLRTGMAYQTEMIRFKNITGGTPEQAKQMSEQVLGSTGMFNNMQKAQTVKVLAQAGLGATEVQGALPTVLDFASVSQIDPQQSGLMAIELMTTYKKTIKDLPVMLAQVAKAEALSAVSMEDIMESLKYVGPVAAATGIEFSELAATLSMLGKAGIKGSIAGTSMRSILVRMMNQTAKGKKTLEERGVSAETSSDEEMQAALTEGAAQGIQLKSISQFFQDLKNSGVTTAELAKIFRVESLPSAAQLTNGVEDLWDTLGKVMATGSEFLRKQAENLENSAQGSWTVAMNALDTLRIRMTESLQPFVKTIADMVSKLSLDFGKLDTESRQRIASIITMITVVLGAVTLFLSVGGFVVNFLAGLTTVASFIAKIPLLMNPFVVAALLVADVFGNDGKVTKTLWDFATNAARWIADALVGSMNRQGSRGNLATYGNLSGRQRTVTKPVSEVAAAWNDAVHWGNKPDEAAMAYINGLFGGDKAKATEYVPKVKAALLGKAQEPRKSLPQKPGKDVDYIAESFLYAISNQIKATPKSVLEGSMWKTASDSATKESSSILKQMEDWLKGKGMDVANWAESAGFKDFAKMLRDVIKSLTEFNAAIPSNDTSTGSGSFRVTSANYSREHTYYSARSYKPKYFDPFAAGKLSDEEYKARVVAGITGPQTLAGAIGGEDRTAIAHTTGMTAAQRSVYKKALRMGASPTDAIRHAVPPPRYKFSATATEIEAAEQDDNRFGPGYDMSGRPTKLPTDISKDPIGTLWKAAGRMFDGKDKKGKKVDNSAARAFVGGKIASGIGQKVLDQSLIGSSVQAAAGAAAGGPLAMLAAFIVDLMTKSKGFVMMMEALNKILQPIVDILGIWFEVLTPLINLIGMILVPVFDVLGVMIQAFSEMILKPLFPIIQFLGIVIMEVVLRIMYAYNWMMKGVQDVVNGIIDWVNRTFNQRFDNVKWTIGTDKMENALAKLRNASWESASAMEDNSKAAKAAAAAISNIPAGLKVALRSHQVAGYDKAFATGGIVTRPTVGLVGEAGPEAVIPLNRAGGLGTTIVIQGDVYGYDDFERKVSAAVAKNNRGRSLSTYGI